MNSRLFFLIIMVLSALSKISAKDDSLKSAHRGKTLFGKHCSSCHNVHKELTGPMLASITKKRPEDWLVSFIKNSQNVILANDEYANHLFERYNRTVMPAFDHLSENEIKNILSHIESESKVAQEKQMNEKLNWMRGKDLFRNHCSPCHFLNSEGYGPSLGSVYKRRHIDWLVKFITNSKTVIDSGDPYANFVYSKFNQKVMPPFEYLDRESIVSIVEYIGAFSQSKPQVAGVNGSNIDKHFGALPHASYEFIDEESPSRLRGIFGKVAMGVVAILVFYVFFRVLRLIYFRLFKS